MTDFRSTFLALAAELEERDERIAAEIEELAGLDRRAAALKESAGAIRTFRERLPSERAHLDQALVEPESDLAGARESLAAAAQALAELEAKRRPDAERLATARRAVAHARDDLGAAESVLARVQARRAALEAEALRLEAEAPGLEADAHQLAAALRALPRVSRSGGLDAEPGLDGLLEWASRAHAALLVARSGLETERERTVREANELGVAALGEDLGATRVSLVRERLERALRA